MSIKIKGASFTGHRQTIEFVVEFLIGDSLKTGVPWEREKCKRNLKNMRKKYILPIDV